MNSRKEMLKQTYKQKPGNFGDSAKNRTKRLEDMQKQRKLGREQILDKRRALHTTVDKSNNVSSGSSARVKKDKKPPFKVGIVRHSIYPTISLPPVPTPKPNKASRSKIINKDIKDLSAQTSKSHQTQPEQTITKKISKATEKRLALKAAAGVTATKYLPSNIVKKQRLNKGISTKIKQKETGTGVTDVKCISNVEPTKIKVESHESKTKRSKSFDNTGNAKLDETFEIDTNKDSQSNSLKSILASAALMTDNSNKNNLTATASFFVPNKHASTPNSSVEDVQLHLSGRFNKSKNTSSDDNSVCNAESDEKLCLKIDEPSTASHCGKNVTEEGREDVDNVTVDQSTFEIKNSSRSSRSSGRKFLNRCNAVDVIDDNKTIDQSTFEIKDLSTSTRKSLNKSDIKNKTISMEISDYESEISLVNHDETRNLRSKKSTNKSFNLNDTNHENNSIDEQNLTPRSNNARRISGSKQLDNTCDGAEVKKSKSPVSKKSPKLRKSVDRINKIEAIKDESLQTTPESTHNNVNKGNFNEKISESEKKLEMFEQLLDSKGFNETKSDVRKMYASRRSSTPLQKSFPHLEREKIPEMKLSRSIILRKSLNTKSVSKDVISNLKTQDSSEIIPALLSPHIVHSRGKQNARKEQEKFRKSIGLTKSSLNEGDIPTKETVMQNLNISTEDEERTAQYFKFLANREVERLTGLCEEWSKKREEETVTDDGKNIINQAIGQTQLLLRKKIQRFLSLVNDCEDGQGLQLVTCKDLQGFWDMTYIEIENCNNRFDTLEKLKARNWQENEVMKPESKAKRKKNTKPRSTQTLNKVIEKPRAGGIRDIIRAAKLNKKKSSQNNEMQVVILDKNQQFDDVLVSNSSALDLPKLLRRSSTPKSAVKVKNVQKVSEKKSISKESPLTVMKVSQLLKTPRVELDNSVVYVNSSQTPGKSILKKMYGDSTLNQSRKSLFKVNFDDTNTEAEFPIDEEESTRRSLSEALARIESFEVPSDENNESEDNNYEVTTASQLNFDTSEIVKESIVEESYQEDKEDGYKEDKDDENKENVVDHKKLNIPGDKVTSYSDHNDSETSEPEVIVRSLRNRIVKTPVKTVMNKSKSSNSATKEKKTNIDDSGKVNKKSKNVKGKLSVSNEDVSPAPRNLRTRSKSSNFNKTQERNEKSSPAEKVVHVKEEFIRYHPSQKKKSIPKSTPVRSKRQKIDYDS